MVRESLSICTILWEVEGGCKHLRELAQTLSALLPPHTPQAVEGVMDNLSG